MAKLDQAERNDLARDCTQMAGDLNWAAIILTTPHPVLAILYIRNLEAKAKILFDKLKAEAAD